MTLRRVIYQSVVTTISTLGAVAATTPRTAGIQDFDPPKFGRQFKATQEPIVQTFVTGAVNRSVPDGDGEFRLPLTQKRVPVHLYQDVVNAPQGYVVNNTPTTGLQSSFDAKLAYVGRWLVADFAGATSAPDQTIVTFQVFDRPLPKRKAIFDTNGFAPVPISMAVTLTTAGVQDFDFILFKKPLKSALQQFTPFAPFSVSTGTATPITSGLQDFDFVFKRPFKSALQQNEINTGIFAPIATFAGLQNLDWSFQKPFKASLQQQELNTPSGTYIVANTPITGGIQGFDFAYKKSFSASLQALGTWGTSVIVVASTPSSFQFASLDMKVLRQVFPAYQQQFVAAQMIGDVPAPPPVTEVHNFPFIANVGTMMQRW